MIKTFNRAVFTLALGCVTLLTLGALSAVPAVGSGLEDLQISGQTVTGRIALPGGIEASLEITFENVQNLTLANLGLSAELVSLTDPGLLARFPSGAVASIPAAFPVLLRFVPPATSTLSFQGVVSAEIYTHHLTYTPGTQLRLFSAEPGGPFEDVSAWMDSGSYRVGAVHPEFYREQLIVLDTRMFQAVISQQADALEQTLDNHVGDIDTNVFLQLESLIDQARTQISNDDVEGAQATLSSLQQTVVSQSGESIPDAWAADEELTNVAGRLRADIARLSHSLQRQGGSS